MRIISYNILDGGVGRADAIAGILCANRPDLVCLVEAEDEVIAHRLAKRLNMECLLHRGRKRACVLLSRYPIAESVNHALRDPAFTNNCSQLTLTRPDGELPVFMVHLHARATIADEQVRVSEVEALLRITSRLRIAGRPHLVMGDFNANSPIQRIVRERCKPKTRTEMDANGGMIPREAIGRMLAAGYVDTLHAVMGDPAADLATFTTEYPGQRLDYIFAHGLAPEHFRAAWVVNDEVAKAASDHFPIGLEIV